MAILSLGSAEQCAGLYESDTDHGVVDSGDSVFQGSPKGVWNVARQRLVDHEHVAAFSTSYWKNGSALGPDDGDNDGRSLGTHDGDNDGRSLGIHDGDIDGRSLGIHDGDNEGRSLGTPDGDIDGSRSCGIVERVMDGACAGFFEGDGLGMSQGGREGRLFGFCNGGADKSLAFTSRRLEN